MICRTAQFSVTLKDPYTWFQGHAILWCWISQNTDSFTGILIGTYTFPTQQCHFEWPWVTVSDLAKYSMTRSVARSLCDSWASCSCLPQAPVSYPWNTYQKSAPKTHTRKPVPYTGTKIRRSPIRYWKVVPEKSATKSHVRSVRNQYSFSGSGVWRQFLVYHRHCRLFGGVVRCVALH